MGIEDISESSKGSSSTMDLNVCHVDEEVGLLVVGDERLHFVQTRYVRTGYHCMGDDKQGFVPHGFALVIKHSHKARDAQRRGVYAFLSALGSGGEDGGEELYRVEPRVEIVSFEKVEEQGNVLLPHGELVREP